MGLHFPLCEALLAGDPDSCGVLGLSRKNPKWSALGSRNRGLLPSALVGHEFNRGSSTPRALPASEPPPTYSRHAFPRTRNRTACFGTSGSCTRTRIDRDWRTAISAPR